MSTARPPTQSLRRADRFEDLIAHGAPAGSREPIEVRAPFTGETICALPRCIAEDVQKAISAAREAQPRWAALPVRVRARTLLRFHDLLLERREEVLDLIQLEAGKTRRDAFEEVLDTAVVARHYAVHGPRLLRPRRVRGALPLLTRTVHLRHPLGVVGVIVPWNYPLNLGVTDAIPALLAGNAVVLKPDHQTSLTSLWAVARLREAGLPAGVLTVVTGEGSELGPPLIDGIDYLMFTGSTRTGRIVGSQAGERLIGTSLELGGKNPMIVLEDADLDRAVRGAVRGCFVGAGQVCVSCERLYLHAGIYDRFLERFVERVQRLRLSPALDFTGEMGSLVSAEQLAVVAEHVDDARRKGATVLAGGRARPEVGPFFYEPTVLTGITPEMAVYADETFGPVVSVYRVGTDEEAIRLANASRYGLSASVWSRDVRRAERVAACLRVGSVNVNEAYAAAWGSAAAPMGGMKDSGLGRRHGVEGLLKYTESQTIAIQRGPMISAPPGVGEESYARVMTGLLRVLRHLPGLR